MPAVDDGVDFERAHQTSGRERTSEGFGSHKKRATEHSNESGLA